MAVVVVVVTVAGIGRAMHSPTGRAPTTMPGPGPVVAGPPISYYVSLGQVPPYYVAITSHGNPNSSPLYAVVRATATGKTLATIQPSMTNGSIVAVTAAADDRTFVLDELEGSSGARTFYEFRLSSAGRPGPLTRLPWPISGSTTLTGFALSPDGSKLAIAVQPHDHKQEPSLTLVSVYTIATGAVRVWTANGTIGEGQDNAQSLSWTTDGRTLAFDWEGSGRGLGTGVWLLNLSARGSDLLGNSRRATSTRQELLLFGEPSTGATANPGTTTDTPTVTPSSAYSSSLSLDLQTCAQDSIITPDGSAVICGSITPTDAKAPANGRWWGAETEFREYSAVTGKVARILGHWTFGNAGTLDINVLWSNASGSVLIAVIPNAGHGQVGVISANTFTPLDAQVASLSSLSGTW